MQKQTSAGILVQTSAGRPVRADRCGHTSDGPQVTELTVSSLALPHSTAIQHGQPLHPCNHLHTTVGGWVGGWVGAGGREGGRE